MMNFPFLIIPSVDLFQTSIIGGGGGTRKRSFDSKPSKFGKANDEKRRKIDKSDSTADKYKKRNGSNAEKKASDGKFTKTKKSNESSASNKKLKKTKPKKTKGKKKSHKNKNK